MARVRIVPFTCDECGAEFAETAGQAALWIAERGCNGEKEDGKE